MKPTLKAPGTKHLKLTYYELVSNNAFKFYLRRYTKVAKVLGKILNRVLGGAFQSWYDVLQESKNQEEKMQELLKQAVLKMLRATLAKSFNRWRDYAVEHAEMMRKLKMAAMKMVKAKLAACFAKWQDFVADAIEERAHMEEMMKKAMGKFMNRYMAQAFERWHEATLEHGEMRRIIMGTLLLLRHPPCLPTLVSCFGTHIL